MISVDGRFHRRQFVPWIGAGPERVYQGGHVRGDRLRSRRNPDTSGRDDVICSPGIRRASSGAAAAVHWFDRTVFATYTPPIEWDLTGMCQRCQDQFIPRGRSGG